MTRVSAKNATRFEIGVTATAGRVYAPALRRRLQAACGLAPLAARGPRDISLALVGNARMAALHEQFLGIPGPTDVLTFELDHDARGRVTGGEIVVCVPHAIRTARRLGHRPADELLLYAIHGLLHLCGYDDRTDVDFRRMHRLEDRILTQLGIGAVFARGAGDAPA
ncbi:MAG TPA: rRNA maturation RNase YbeY [Tepidisphaeraceae bacterium]|jgi:probable rRNA maturation factor